MAKMCLWMDKAVKVKPLSLSSLSLGPQRCLSIFHSLPTVIRHKATPYSCTRQLNRVNGRDYSVVWSVYCLLVRTLTLFMHNTPPSLLIDPDTFMGCPIFAPNLK